MEVYLWLAEARHNNFLGFPWHNYAMETQESYYVMLLLVTGKTTRWLSRDNLSSLLFALVVYGHVKTSWFTYLLDSSQTISSLKCDLDLQPTWTNVSHGTWRKNNYSAKLFWNPCINVEVMTPEKLNLDHFIVWPSCVTLTFNLLEQMFQIALLLLKENDHANYFEMQPSM